MPCGCKTFVYLGFIKTYFVNLTAIFLSTALSASEAVAATVANLLP